MEKWNEICYLIKKHQKNNSREDIFQTEIENIFEKLGWARYLDEIISKQRIRIGANNYIEPDVIINLNQQKQFVIQIKRPNNISDIKQEEQLFSYMRQLKLKFGIIIDNSFQIYYDDMSDDDPIKIFEPEFIENCKEGQLIIDLFSKHKFNKENLKNFCDLKLEEYNDIQISEEIVESLKSQGENRFIELLKKEFKDDYNDNIISNVKNKIQITVSTKNSNIERPYKEIKDIDINTKSEPLPMEFIPSDRKIFKKLLLRKKWQLK